MCSPSESPGAVTRDHHPPALFRTFLHCYYKNVYGIRPVTRELQNTVVGVRTFCLRSTAVERRGRSFPHRPRTRRRRGLRRAFQEQAACRGLLDSDPLPIDSTDVMTMRTMPADQDASKGYDPTAEEYYHGYGCMNRLDVPGKRSRLPRSSPSSAMSIDGDARHV